MNGIYTGIGARTTPHHILLEMRAFGEAMAKLDFTLRSGGAAGADSAFETGCDLVDPSNKEIYLPWKGFNDNDSPEYEITDEAISVALQYHPNHLWLKDSKHVLKLMARNGYQILGKHFHLPTDFVMCWTQDGVESTKPTKATGGTGQAIRIAQAHNIPVFNLKNEDAIDRALELVHQNTNLLSY